MKSENIFNKNENKLYTFLGGFLGFIIATVLYFFAAQNNIRHIVVIFRCGNYRNWSYIWKFFW